jgi:hypothetical protein
MQQEGVWPNSVTFVAVLNACANIVALEVGRSAMSRSFKVDGIQMSKWGIAWLTCMQNVGACRMHRECSTRCHHMMWSLGMPYLEDVPCMAMVMKLLNILNRCVKVYSQMISLLFVFCQLVAMQVWWMKVCVVMCQ